MGIASDILDDNEKGAERLFEEYGSRLTAAAFVLCGNEVDAKDLVSETVDIAIRQIGTCRKESALFEWLYGIMRNRYRNGMRRKSVTNEVPVADLPDESIDGPVDGAAQIEQAIDAGVLRDAVNALPAEMREAVVLRYFMDMPLMQIAKFLSLPVGTVKSRLYYARVALSKRLGAVAKKPAAVLAAALLFLAVSAAVVVGNVKLRMENEELSGDSAAGTTAATDVAPEDQFQSVPDVPFIPDVPVVSEVPYSTYPSTQQGETTMTRKKAAAAALSAAMAVGPLAAANGDEYQFIISGDPVAAATEGSSSASSGTCALTGGPLADGTVFASSLEGRYRTMDDSPARKLRSDKFKTLMISFK